MQSCSPIEFASRWQCEARPFTFPVSLPLLPDNCISILREYGLPREVSIRCYNDISLKFHQTLTPLELIWSRHIDLGCKLGKMPSEWKRFWHVGDTEYLQGGAWICLEESTGRIFAIDLDLPEPVYLVNSSVANLYTTLNALLLWTKESTGDHNAMMRLRADLKQQDCIPPDELNAFWLNNIEASVDNRISYLAFHLVS
ncbi:SUKH-4 family immunity protein [Lacunimicrobium album]